MIGVAIRVGIVVFLLFCIVVIWAVCKVSGQANDDEEQMRWLKERKDKDDMPM